MGRSPRRSTARIAAAVGTTIAVVVVGIFGIVALASWESADGGHVVVIRNGGPFDNTQIRQVIQPGSGREYAGLFSDSHPYPSTQRFFTFSAADQSDGPEITVPTGKGIEVGIEGNVYFQLTLDEATIEDFDNKYGTRTYATSDGGQKAAWEARRAGLPS